MRKYLALLLSAAVCAVALADPPRVIDGDYLRTTVGASESVATTDIYNLLAGGGGSGITLGSPANGLSLSSGVLSLGLASSIATGALSSADWNTFNGKQAAISAGGTKYVDPIDGNDSTCDGSIGKQCKTLAKAYALITDNADTKPFAVRVTRPGVFTESRVTLKPWVSLYGAGQANTVIKNGVSYNGAGVHDTGTLPTSFQVSDLTIQNTASVAIGGSGDFTHTKWINVTTAFNYQDFDSVSSFECIGCDISPSVMKGVYGWIFASIVEPSTDPLVPSIDISTQDAGGLNALLWIEASEANGAKIRMTGYNQMMFNAVRGITSFTGVTDSSGTPEFTYDALSAPASFVGSLTQIKSTGSDSINEGSTNLFFTNARARSAVSASSPLQYSPSTGVFSVLQSSGSQSGYLSATDWTTFNSKEPAIASSAAAKVWFGDKVFHTITTDSVSEGPSNLYWTQARFNTALSGKSTSDLSEGSNQYFTNARAIGAPITGFVSGAGTLGATDSVLAALQKLDGNVSGKEPSITAGSSSQYYRGDKTMQTLNTAAVSESGNLYYLDSRARAALSGTSPIGYNSSTGAITLSTVPIGSGGTNATTAQAAINNLAGLTSKGDILIYDGVNVSRLAVGLDGSVAMADSTQNSGFRYDFPTALFGKREMQVLITPGASTVTTVGLSVAPTMSTTASNTDDSAGPWINHATTTTSGSSSGPISAAFTTVRRDWEPEYITTIRTDASAITSVRYWIGLFSGAPDGFANPSGLHMAAFRYDTSADGTAFWRTVTKDGTTQLVKTTTQAIAANTSYTLKIVCSNANGGQVQFYINNVLVSSHTANLPTSSQLMGYGNRVTTLTTAARNLKWGRIAIRHN